MTQAWYHIVVIGTDLAGLMYAALAARRGYRVCVVGQGGRPSAYKHQGFWFLREPELFYGFASSPAVQRVFGELSLGLEMKNRPQPLEPAYQLAIGPGMTRAPSVEGAVPRFRLDVSGQRRHWERDVERELPGALEVLDRFDERALQWKRDSDPLLGEDVPLPPSGLRGRATWKRLADPIRHLLEGPGEHALAAELRDFVHRVVVQAPLVHLSDLLPTPPALLPVARLWTHLRAGLHRFPGGLDGMKQMFLRKLREQSGDYRPDAYATQLVLKRGKVQAVQLGERNEALGCELVLGNTDPRRVLGLVPRDQRADGFHSAMAGLEPAGWRFVMNLGVDPKVIPQGMAPEVVLVEEPLMPLVGANCLWISRPGSDPHGSHLESRPGPGVIRVSALLPARAAMPTLAGVQRTAEEAMAATRRLIPWLDESLKVVDVPALVPHGGDPTSVDVDADALRPVMARPLRDTLDAAPFELETPYKNVLLGGDLAFAGLGFEGTCLSALQALHLTRESVRLPPTATGRR
ncbi:MAG: hypothetical protein IT385_26295 [Deltaproteobacteria bacterium]|nr:hypothetical protein [Deltaproteobacteria bacterium]